MSAEVDDLMGGPEEILPPEEEPLHIRVAAGLKKLADWYMEHPELNGVIGAPNIYVRVIESSQGGEEESKKEVVLKNLGLIARAMSPCEKFYGDYNIAISTKKFAPVDITASISREAVCKKIVKWECPESLLSLLGASKEEVEKVGGVY